MICRSLVSVLSIYFFFGLPQGLFAQCPITVDAGEDIYLCAPPSATNLNGSIDGDYLNFTWTPPNGLIGGSTLTPTVNVQQTTTYYLTGQAVDLTQNAIVNGDFEGGNFGFTSDYLESPGNLVPEGVYEILTDPSASHPNFAACGDHTSGSGNMMAVNGSGVPNENVWCQTVAVQPNTNYAFSAWVASLISASPAVLQFSINGSPLGPFFSPPASTCVWTNFYQFWNSGSNTSATICIVNQNTALSGNDFALDDITMSPVCEVTDSVTVHVININAVAAPPLYILPCEGSQTTISGIGSSTGPDITYLWETPNGNIVSGANTLEPVIDMPGSYTLNVIYDNGFVNCVKQATVNVILTPNPLTSWILPPPPLGCGFNQVQLIGGSSQPGFSSYQWTTSDGNIVNGSNLSIATVNAAGTYHLLVTNTATGCTSEAEVTVIEETDPPVAAVAPADPIDCIQLSTSLSGQGSSTGSNITYNWTAQNGGVITSGQDSIEAVGSAGGTYILTVTDEGNGCTASDTIVVNSNTNPPQISFGPSDTLDCLVDSIFLSITTNPTSALPVWTSGNGGNILSGDSTNTILLDAPGDYFVSVLDTINGCTATDTIEIFQDILDPLAVAGMPDTITCINPSIDLSGEGSSVGNTISYLWTAGPGGNIVMGDTTLFPEVNAPGTYTLLVTNLSNGCTASVSTQVVADTNAIVAVANAPDTLNCSILSVDLNAMGSTSDSTISYFWTTSDGQIDSGADTPMPTVLAPGTYTLLLTNTSNGCTATDIAIVQQNTAAPDLIISPPAMLNCNQPVIQINATNNGPAGSYDYSWSASNGGNIVNGANGLNPEVDAEGDYTLIAINTLTGCSDTAAVSVSLEAGTPVPVILPADTINCTNPSITLDGTLSSSGPAFSYSWTAGPGGNILSGASGPNPVVDSSAWYFLVLTNVNTGCIATDSVFVAVDQNAPPADAGIDGLLTCLQTSFLLSGNSGLQQNGLLFHWESLDTGNLVSDPDSFQVICDAAGTYLLEVRDLNNGCIAFDTVLVVADQVDPSLVLAIPDTLNCVRDSALLSGTMSSNSGVLNFAWETSNGSLLSAPTDSAVWAGSPGMYTLTITDPGNGCTAGAAVLVVQDLIPPVLAVAQPFILNCTDTVQTLLGSSQPATNISVVWETNDGFILTGANNLNPEINAPGFYQMTVTNLTNGCVDSTSVSVNQDILPPSVEAGLSDTLDCGTTSLGLFGAAFGQGNLNYQWTSTGGGSILSGGNTLNPVIDAPGNYYLEVLDEANGCTAVDSLTIFNDLSAPFALAGPSDTLNCDINQLNLQGDASLGPNFSYQWSAGAGGNIVSGANSLTPLIDASGTYSLLVTNSDNGCTSTSQVQIIPDYAPPVIDAGAADVLDCSNSEIQLSGSAAAPGNDVSVVWTGAGIVSGNQSNTPVVDAPGWYVYFVENNLNGCTAVDSVQVGIDTIAPVVSIAQAATLTCSVPVITLAGSVQLPQGSYQVDWTSSTGNILSGADGLNPEVDQAADYLMTVVNDQNGCSATMSVSVPQDTVAPIAQAQVLDTLDCIITSLSIDGSASSSGMNYVWMPGPGGQIVSGSTSTNPVISAPGEYTLMVTNPVNGCTEQTTVTVNEDVQTPVIAILNPDTLNCLVDTLDLSSSVSGSGLQFDVQWTTSNGNLIAGTMSFTPTVDQPGIYILTATDLQNGCTATEQIEVPQDIVTPVADAGESYVLHCNQMEVNLDGSGQGSGVLSYNWTTHDGQIVEGASTLNPVVAAAGNYALVVTNETNGCTATDFVIITEVLPPLFDVTLLQPNCMDPLGMLQIEPGLSGQQPFSYSIDGGATAQADPAFAGLSPGNYTVVMTDDYGCTSSENILINEVFEPELILPDWIPIEFGDSTLLQPFTNIPAGQVASWSWTPSEGLSCTDCERPWAKPYRNIQYTLEVSDLNGCTATAQVVVGVSKNRKVYAPNIFSPNDDGFNDRFMIFGKAVQEIKLLEVYDRWGTKLFVGEQLEPNNENQGWDGTYRGEQLNPAVFAWLAIVVFDDGEEVVLAGDVTLYR